MMIENPRPPISDVITKLFVFSSTQSSQMPAAMMLTGQTKLIGNPPNQSHCTIRPVHEAKNSASAVYTPPVGIRHASHWMYCSADGMMITANGVTIGHHCRSFQSVQKSQSPANSSFVMSTAAATTKMAVIQKTASHLRSMKV